MSRESASLAAPVSQLVAGDGYDRIRELLPHKEPFIFVEKIVELERGRRIVCLKNVSCNEWYMSAHFPGFAIMPGVLIVEAMAQSALLLILSSYPERRGQMGVLRAAQTRFHRAVLPGDQLLIEIVIDKIVSNGCVVSGKTTIHGQTAVTGEIVFGLADRDKLMQRRET